MICPQFYPIVGGYERAAERLSAALVHEGAQVSVVTFKPHATAPKRERLRGFEVTRLWSTKARGLSTITTIISLLTFLLVHGRKFDLWHCHAPTPAVAAAIGLARLLRVPVIVKLPSSGTNGIGAAFREGVLGRLGLMRPLFRTADAIIVMTDDVRREALRHGINSSRVHLIPNGVDTEVFKPATDEAERLSIRRRLGMRENAIVALQVCRMDRAKNLPGLLDAWASLPTPFKADKKLAIVGDGPLTQRIRARVTDSGLQGSVMLPGARKDVVDWYKAADFYILSSFYEGLSNSLLEAMSSGLPILMTDVSGRELVSTDPAAGIVTPVDDAPTLRSGILALAQDVALRQSCGANARSRIVQGFSIQHVATRMLALYRTLSCDRGGADIAPTQ